MTSPRSPARLDILMITVPIDHQQRSLIERPPAIIMSSPGNCNPRLLAGLDEGRTSCAYQHDSGGGRVTGVQGDPYPRLIPSCHLRELARSLCFIIIIFFFFLFFITDADDIPMVSSTSANADGVVENGLTVDADLSPFEARRPRRRCRGSISRNEDRERHVKW